jgi:purine-binding chemotaxis protein CheW
MENRRFIELALDGTRVAFPLADVARVVRAVDVTVVPGASACLLGIVDVAGATIPVYDMRHLLGLPVRAVRVTDRMVLTRGAAPKAFVADHVLGTCHGDTVAAPESFSLAASGVRGVVKSADGLLTVHDFRRFMALERAMPMLRHD